MRIPFFLDMNRGGEEDIRNFVERMIRVPRVDDEELGSAQPGDHRGIFGSLAELRIADVEHNGKNRKVLIRRIQGGIADLV